jgi:hypothetical protein
MGQGDTLLNAAIGAVVTVVLSFIGVSPVLGGGVAGYLQQSTRKAGAKVGALSGALASIPFLLVVVFGLLFLIPVGVSGGMGGMVGLPGGVELVIIFLVILPLTLAWNVGLGALGGYLGTYIYEEMGSGSGRADPSR